MKAQTRLNWGLLAALALAGVSLSSIIAAISEAALSPYIAPRPDDLFRTLILSPGEWARAVLWTFSLSSSAAVISVVLGVAVGFGASFARLWAIDKWCQLIWSIPLIAIATYLLLAVGYGWAYGLSLGVFLGIYPIQKHVFDCCSARSEGICSVSASFGLSRWQEYRYLRLTAAFRSMGTALSQALPLCFIGETMGEFTSAQISPFSIGLGGLLRFAQNYSNYAQLWLSIILMMFLVFFSGEAGRVIWAKLFPRNDDKEMFQ